ncbi:MAG TPA: diphosphomevalonate decarboxylase [Bacteroidales bacterium]|nr:diphosphomevalonate decarboxylase [Bacteroidales bacterium]
MEKILGWESPSNIALVKYWGKLGNQLPMNPSISFTLKNSVVRLKVKHETEDVSPSLLKSFILNGQPNEKFRQRIQSFLESIKLRYDFLGNIALEIESQSTFPHSAGIASSAAAFSALALVLQSLKNDLDGNPNTESDFWRESSISARLGSGSACRSVYGGFTLWGQSPALPASSNEYAVMIDTKSIHPVFTNIRDAILIADDSEKSVSSSMGHSLMHNHPYRETRIAQAEKNINNLLHALKTGEEQLFAEIVENEALSLHGLMMTSNPGFVLLKPATLAMIERIRNFRNNTGINICFTLDAGPNIHLIYFEKDKQPVSQFIQNEMVGLCKNGKWIDDMVGTGPVKLSE